MEYMNNQIYFLKASQSTLKTICENLYEKQKCTNASVYIQNSKQGLQDSDIYVYAIEAYTHNYSYNYNFNLGLIYSLIFFL